MPWAYFLKKGHLEFASKTIFAKNEGGNYKLTERSECVQKYKNHAKFAQTHITCRVNQKNKKINCCDEHEILIQTENIGQNSCVG